MYVNVLHTEVALGLEGRGVLVGLGGYLQDAILGVFPPILSLKYLHPMLVYP